MKNFALLIFRRIFAVPDEGTRGVAQLASASGLGPEGPVFESQYPDIEGNSLIFSGFLFLWYNGHFGIMDIFGISRKSMCLSIYLSKSEQEVFDI